MLARRRFATGLVLATTLAAIACSSSDSPGPSSKATDVEVTCGADALTKRFPSGSPDGHPDPFGAKAAGQARAGKIRDMAGIKRPDDARNRLVAGDYVLANDKIAVFVEGARESDGYDPFGGEINAVEVVDESGRPTGVSQYGEMLLALSRQVVAPESVTVMADGSDGKAAIVRASGVLKNIPFLQTFRGIFPDEYDFPAALDYVLEPGAEKVTLRLSLMNTRTEAVDFIGKQMFGFFHSNRARLFTEKDGYAPPRGPHPWFGYDGERSTFAFQQVGKPLELGLEVSGFQYFLGSGLTLEACKASSTEYAEIIVGGAHLDGLRKAVRRTLGEPPGRTVRGTTESVDGAKLAGAWVVALGEGGRVLSRVKSGPNGAFALDIPKGAAPLQAALAGYGVAAPVAAPDGEAVAKVTFERGGTLDVSAKDMATSEGLPVRIQVIPQAKIAAPPGAWGIPTEANGRLFQAFAMDGTAKLAVPPGSYRVIVSRGYEYELVDVAVSVEAGKSTPVEARLARSVDSTGVMCADFHIHSNFSADSDDIPIEKVKSAIADGLELPISSEHEWIIDFQPIITRLGLDKWASSFPSQELTTFTYGHYGVIPLNPIAGATNNGAVNWIGKDPPEIFKIVHSRPEKPALIINHPTGGGFGAYFSAAGLDNATGTGKPGLWSDDFEAIEVFNDSDFEKNRGGAVAGWFALLNAGKTMSAVGSSDSHHIRSSPVGYPRTCLRFGSDDPRKGTAEATRDLIKSGASTISGGLFMTVAGPGDIGPGGKSTAGAYKVTVQSPSWISASELEVLVDGESVKKVPLTAAAGPGPGKRYEATIDVQAASSRPRHFVIFSAKGPGDLAPLHPGRAPFAVSNPIYF